MFLLKKTPFFIVWMIVLSFVLPLSQNCALSNESNEKVQKSPEEIQALNKQAEKDLAVLTKTYGCQLQADILGANDLPERTQDVSFEKLDGILNNFSVEKDAAIKMLAKIFDLFPKKWILDMEVFFEDSNKKLQNTSTLEDIPIWGEENFNTKKKKFIIRIYKNALTEYKNATMLDNTICHEIAHANDWRSNREMAVWEKVEFFKSVVERYNAKNRYHEKGADKYLESIDFGYKDITDYNRVLEYWAIIVAIYISQDSKGLPEADQALVKSILERTNPARFDQIKQKASLRQGIWAGILAKPKTEDHNISVDKNSSSVTYIINGGTIIAGTK